MGRARSVLVGTLTATRLTLQRAVDVLRYVTMSVMRRADVERSIVTTWSEWADDSTTLFPWEQEVYDRVLKSGDRILVVGCGRGRDLIALIERGYRAEGLELVPASATIARARLAQRGLDARVLTGNVRTVALDGAYDVVVFSWFCYGYIPEAATRVAILRKVAAHLAPGGRVVISYIPDPVGVHPRTIPFARWVGRLARSGWRLEDGDMLSEAEDGAIAYEHHFTPDALAAEARAAGFRVVHHHAVPDQPSMVLAADDQTRWMP